MQSRRVESVRSAHQLIISALTGYLGRNNPSMGQDTDRKKQLKRAYLKTPKTMGAYCIRNLENGKTFVGVSRDVPARLNRHRFTLRMGSEDIAALQADWLAFGADAFAFELLQTLEPPADVAHYDPDEDLQALAALWCEQLNCFAPGGYNPAAKS